jgi:glycosyltransferase involved in cell wall biosynthesis
MLETNRRDHVSIVIPTYNSAKHLSTCLDAVKRQKYPYKELLVVDNYSSDSTRRIAETFGAHVTLHRGTQAAARNMGLAQSKGNYVLFLDSDQQLCGEVIANCVQLCSNHEVDAVKIPEVFMGLNFWGKCSALWKNNMVKAWGPEGGIPRFYKKETLVKQLVFNNELRWWEDMELYQRMKSTGLKEAWSTGQIIHFETDSPKKAVQKYMTYGQSVSAFKENEAEAPYEATLRITLSTTAQLLRESGRSLSVFLGCLLLVTVKTFSVALGFLSRLT